MHFNPSFGRDANGQNEPFGVGPDGTWVWSAQDLPELPLPGYVMVADGLIVIDGWMFPVKGLRKPFLIWFQASTRRWWNEDTSASSRRWLEGILDASVNMIASKA